MRRYGSNLYSKAQYYYDRKIYHNDKPIGIWENWACCWKLDWSFFRRGIYITSLWLPGGMEMYKSEDCPEGMRQPTQDEREQYLEKSRELFNKRNDWLNEHPYQAAKRQREAEAAAEGKRFDAYQDFLENG